MTESQIEQKALALLARRDVSRVAMTRQLYRWGCDEEMAASLIERLVEWGYLDDERVAGALARRRTGQGYGPRRIRQEMQQAGLAGPLPEVEIDDGLPDWASRARAVWRRRFGTTSAGDARERARRIRFMLARGFTLEHVRACMEVDSDDLPPDPED